MNKPYTKLDIFKKISLVLLLLPVYLGSYLSQEFNLPSLAFLVIILAPFYFQNLDKLIESFYNLTSVRSFKYLILLVAYSLISLIYSLNSSLGFSIIAIIILSVFVGVLFSQFKVMEIYKYIAWSGLTYTIILYLEIPHLFFNYFTESQRFAYYHGDISMNPNYYSVFLIFFIIYFLYSIIKSNSRFTRLINLLAFCLTVFFIFETQSRTGFVTVILILLFAFIIRKNMQTIIVSSLFVTFLLFVLLLNVNFNFESRLFEADVNNRDNNWKVAIEKYIESPQSILFGNGMGSSSIVIGESNNVYFAINEKGQRVADAHNMYIEYLLDVGIIGLILLCAYLIGLAVFNYKDSTYLNFLPSLLIIIVILLSGLAGNQTRSYHFMIMFSIVIANTIQRKKKLNKGDLKPK
ncbi:O-antigen ligase family protein [Virgibacillus halodenitrificans]|uniref:O-antigen ligase family protein n=1 Tax=Virgibacillus halodenitrificans TaxID=1482 RepID=A0ABR7VJ79_VIRHA|nr:O-antigen ligase family protein [Virgibacillus halodenitrificans]MBD1221300.1 O-antigen ligase family protein [Virgibacillus halodenitrificans]